MGQHAALRGDLEAPDDVVEHGEEIEDRRHVVAGRVNADHGVAAAEHEAVDDRSGDAALVVGRVIGLQAHGHTPLEAERVAKAGHDLDLACREDEILVAHDFGDRGRHLGGDARGYPRKNLGRGFVGEQPIAKGADCHVRHGDEGRRIVAVDDEARHVAAFIGNERLGEEPLQRHIRERHLGGDVLLGVAGRDPGEHVARARRRRFAHQLLQVREPVGDLLPRRVVHGPSPQRCA